MLHMLQCLYTYVASVYPQYFICFFKCMLRVCLSGCCYMFHTYVASVLSRCCVYLQWFSSVSSIFRRMLQVLYLDVLKVDWVLHTGCAWEAGGGVSSPRVGARKAGVGVWHGREVQARTGETKATVPSEGSVSNQTPRRQQFRQTE